MDVNKILQSDLLDLIFEDRNKAYGAYDLRRTYKKRLTIALVCTAAVAILALGGSLLASSLKKSAKGKLDVRAVELANIDQEEEKKPEPPPPPPPKQEPPKVEMQKFTPPKIVKDEEVKKEDIPPETKELETAKIDVQTQEGVQEVAAPVVIDEGKNVIEEKKEDDENKVFEKVEVEASFPGGEREWRKYLERNLDANTPVENGAPEGTYTVVIQFIVDREGNISEVKSLTDKGYGMEEEAAKIIKRGPKWVPAVQNGRQVKAYRKQPITFVVSAE